jgi:hypothetical protein
MYHAVQFDEAALKRIGEAAQFEKRIRLDALLSLPTQIGRFELRPITLKDALIFEAVENRLAIGEQPELDDWAHLVWQQRTDKEKRSQRKFIPWACKQIAASKSTQRELTAYFIAAFEDAPGVASASQSGMPDSSLWSVSVFDVIAHEYGWSRSEIADTPISFLFQLFQRIIYRNSNGKRGLKSPITARAKAKELDLLRFRQEVANG